MYIGRRRGLKQDRILSKVGVDLACFAMLVFALISAKSQREQCRDARFVRLFHVNGIVNARAVRPYIPYNHQLVYSFTCLLLTEMRTDARARAPLHDLI